MDMANPDIDAILARRHDNGADYWATPDGKIYVGNPFSTLSSLGMLHELGVPSGHEAVAGGLELILTSCRADGRIRVGPKSPLRVTPLRPPASCVDSGFFSMRGFSEPSSISFVTSIHPEDGAATSRGSGGALKQRVPIQGQPSMCWTPYGSMRTTDLESPRSTMPSNRS